MDIDGSQGRLRAVVFMDCIGGHRRKKRLPLFSDIEHRIAEGLRNCEVFSNLLSTLSGIHYAK